MGYDTTCTLHFDGRTARGKAFLEQHDLIFRGPLRLAIPLKHITSAVAGDGALTVRFGRRTATFDLGKVAGRWARRIMNPPSRLDKLGVKTGMAVLAAGASHEDLLEEVASRGAGSSSGPRQARATSSFTARSVARCSTGSVN